MISIENQLYIEMKKPRGRLTDAQADLIPLFQDQNNRVEVCIGWEAAVEILTEYLSSFRRSLDRRQFYPNAVGLYNWQCSSGKLVFSIRFNNPYVSTNGLNFSQPRLLKQW